MPRQVRAPRGTSTRGRGGASLAPPKPPVSRASPAIELPPETPNNEVRTQVCAIFRDAQRNTASHRKLAVRLRKLQERTSYRDADASTLGTDEATVFNEETFNTEVARCVLRVMPVRKAESAGEKTVRFIGLFMRHAQDKDHELAHPEGEGEDDEDEMPETPTTRLISHIMETVLPLSMAKDKFVRFRSTQLIAHIVNSLDAIDDDLFQKLRKGLLKRIRDKEAMVRAQAVLGLGRMVGNQAESGGGASGGDGGSDDENDDSLLIKLLSVMQNDPSAEVRRSLLVHLPILSATLPHLLARARDQDMTTRRAVYARLLPALGDFRHLSLSMREKLLRWGLRDRDENVRKAAQRLFRERWIEDCVGPPEEGEDGQAAPPLHPGQQRPPKFEALFELLERIDVVNSGVENGVALEAMKGFWDGRPDYRDAVEFDDRFWETLSAESVFMARTFNDYCRGQNSAKYERLVDEKLPEVTRLAFYLDRYIQALLITIKRIEDANDDEEEEDTVEQEFIIEQLLHIAMTLDYSDEVGRRKMFALLRQFLSAPLLPDEVTKLVVSVLRDVCGPDAAGEKEFCSVVLEAVADVHDTILDDDDTAAPFEREESFHSARSEVSGAGDATPTRDGSVARRGGPELSEEEAAAKAIKEIVVNMKCLHIVQCMLTHVVGNLQENDHLVSMLNNLVVPAVRSHEAPVRERGLVCLGLCSLLDRSLAEENCTLFVHFFAKGHTALQITALEILTDILNVHGAQLVQAIPTLLKTYVKALRLGARAPDVQAAATVAVSKLLLGRVIVDREAAQELLRSLVVAYFDPASAENQSVRQALNYFLPVFCYSRAENQDLMRAVALDALHALHNVRDGLEDDDADVDEVMVGMTTIAACLVDWTDPRKCYTPGIEADAVEKRTVNADVHLQFAQDIINKLDTSISKEEKKVIASLLGKLHISAGSTPEKTRETYAEVCAAVEDGLVTDTLSRNALYKIHASLGRIVNILDAGTDGATPTTATIPSRRSVSVVAEDVSEPAGAARRKRMATPSVGEVKEEEDDDGDDDEGEAKVVVVDVDADDDGGGDSDDTVVQEGHGARRKRRRRSESASDAD